jgi:type IV pilus assembly protein PilX
MSMQHLSGRGRQGGIVLVASLLLLLVITILALAMFRSMGLGEKIAGNVREKQRALHSAMVAEQYAELLIGSGNLGSNLVTCGPSSLGAGPASDANYAQVVMCNNGINPAAAAPHNPNPATLPWTDGSGNPLGMTYTLPPAVPMYLAANNGTLSNTYSQAPAFYIQYMGTAPDGNIVFKIDAVGYGGSALSVAVVESTYEIFSAVKCPSCTP